MGSLSEVVMKTNEISREQISALIDGELSGSQIDIALAALRQSDVGAEWDIYHQIGDVLRSDDMAISLSPGFAARFAERLEAEPTIIAPAMQPIPNQAEKNSSVYGLKRWAVPSMITAAAMAAVAFVTTPQLMVALKGEAGRDQISSIAAAPASGDVAAVLAVSRSAPEGVVLRDARIDDYLLAHQRFSPSVYSSAQFARSATFASDSGK